MPKHDDISLCDGSVILILMLVDYAHVAGLVWGALTGSLGLGRGQWFRSIQKQSSSANHSRYEQQNSSHQHDYCDCKSLYVRV